MSDTAIKVPGGKMFAMSIHAHRTINGGSFEIRHSPTIVSEPSREAAVNFGIELAESQWPSLEGWQHDVVAVEFTFSVTTTPASSGAVNVILQAHVVDAGQAEGF